MKIYTIVGPSSWVEIHENRIEGAEGDLDEISEMLEHWNPIYPTNVPQEVIDNLKAAEKEIQTIRELSKTYPYASDSDRADNARKIVSDDEHEFVFILPEFIEEDWFNVSHGLRNARSKIYRFAASKAKIFINAHNAEEIMKAIRNKEKIPKVSFMIF